LSSEAAMSRNSEDERRMSDPSLLLLTMIVFCLFANLFMPCGEDESEVLLDKLLHSREPATIKKNSAPGAPRFMQNGQWVALMSKIKAVERNGRVEPEKVIYRRPAATAAIRTVCVRPMCGPSPQEWTDPCAKC
jgi:hypothetical protein